MSDEYPFSDMNTSTQGNTVRFDDYQYHKRRCFNAGRREICSGGESFAWEVIEIRCDSDGEVRIDYRRPRDESVYDEDCMVKDGNRYCNSDSYRDKPDDIRDSIKSAIEKYQHRGTYRVYVNVTPSDARIRITNIKPAYEHGMYLAPGRYDFEVSRPGYETKSFYIEHKADSESFMVELEKQPELKGTLSLGIFPEDARVELLGIRETYEPYMELPYGTYRVRLSKPGFDTKIFTVEVNDDFNSSFLALGRIVATSAPKPPQHLPAARSRARS